MAITKIHPIKSTLNLAISYIVNGEKTDKQILVSTHKCHQETAHTQFLRTRNDACTNGTVLARHLIQSFLPGIKCQVLMYKKSYIKMYNYSDLVI